MLPIEPTAIPEPTFPPAATPQLNYFTTASPTLSWNRISWATGYELDVASSPDFFGATRYTTDAGVLSVTVDAPPLDDGRYYWRVRAINPDRIGLWSRTETFVIDSP
jgi:hypothetical protein